mmetsp:Transcript_30019/g.75563  ORF Transcript_30019/g.75563 Transcript_30019/m.75563 type:complete len:724 (-) Transcript_30019:635-2806(-)
MRLLPPRRDLVGLRGRLKRPPVDDDAAKGVEALDEADPSALDVARVADKDGEPRLGVRRLVPRVRGLHNRHVVVHKVWRPVTGPSLLVPLGRNLHQLLAVAFALVHPCSDHVILPEDSALLILGEVSHPPGLNVCLAVGIRHVALHNGPHHRLRGEGLPLHEAPLLLDPDALDGLGGAEAGEEAGPPRLGDASHPVGILVRGIEGLCDDVSAQHQDVAPAFGADGEGGALLAGYQQVLSDEVSRKHGGHNGPIRHVNDLEGARPHKHDTGGGIPRHPEGFEGDGLLDLHLQEELRERLTPQALEQGAEAKHPRLVRLGTVEGPMEDAELDLRYQLLRQPLGDGRHEDHRGHEVLLEEEEALGAQLLGDASLHHEARDRVELLVDQRGAALELVDELRGVADNVGEHGGADDHAEEERRHLVLRVGGEVAVAALRHRRRHPVEAHEVLPAQRRVEHRRPPRLAQLPAVLSLLARRDDDLDLGDPRLATLELLLGEGGVDAGLRVLHAVDEEELVVAAAVEEDARDEVHRDVEDAEELDDAHQAAAQGELLPEVCHVLVHAADARVLHEHGHLDHHQEARHAAPRRRLPEDVCVGLRGVGAVVRDQEVEVDDGLPRHAAHKVEDEPRAEPVREDLGGVGHDLVVVGELLPPEVGGAHLEEEVDEEEKVNGVLKVQEVRVKVGPPLLVVEHPLLEHGQLEGHPERHVEGRDTDARRHGKVPAQPPE